MHFLVADGQISFHVNYNVLKIINLTLIKYSRYSSQKIVVMTIIKWLLSKLIYDDQILF